MQQHGPSRVDSRPTAADASHGHGHKEHGQRRAPEGARSSAEEEEEKEQEEGDGLLRPDAAAQAELERVDELIDALELTAAAEVLRAMVPRLKANQLAGAVQALDVLGQCYMIMRALPEALAAYSELIELVESSEELADSANLYSAAYAVRAGLHGELLREEEAAAAATSAGGRRSRGGGGGGAGSGASARARDADSARAAAAGCPAGYGGALVQEFVAKHELWQAVVRGGTVPPQWERHRAAYRCTRARNRSHTRARRARCRTHSPPAVYMDARGWGGRAAKQSANCFGGLD
jgi:hypothetical protein